MPAHLTCAVSERRESTPPSRRGPLFSVGGTELGDYLESDPAVRGGEPCIAGTRLTVWAVAARLNDGDPLGVLQEENPHVPAEAFLAAYEYALANPRPDFVPPWRRGAEGARAESR